jgi:phosphoribosyl-dephospho-CoA transferase
MEDFLQYPHEMQISIIQELAQIDDQRALGLLEILLGLDSPELVSETVTALGKVRNSAAADVLASCAAISQEPLCELCRRGLRRLAFLNVKPSSLVTPPRLTPFHVAWASPLDGAGYRTLWFARWREQGELSFICLHLHETTGIRAAWGASVIPASEFDEMTKERVLEEGLVRVDINYALQLLRDALFRNRDTLFQLPPEFYVLKSIFTGEDLTPTPFMPDFSQFDLNALAHSNRLIMDGAGLFEDDYFAGWYMATCRVYDFAEEWVSLEKKGDGKSLAKGLDAILDRFCRELVAPIMEQIRNRLLLTADLLLKTGRERAVAEIALASALSLGTFSMPYHLHPFLRQLAIESMDAAREALSEGYDLREHPHEADDDEWID